MISYIGFKINGEDERGLRALTELVRRNKSMNRSITEYNPILQKYYDSFFYILQYILNSDLDSEHKKMLGKMLEIDTSDSEIYILYSAFKDDQHRLALLKHFEFDKRYEKMKTFINCFLNIRLSCTGWPIFYERRFM